MRTKKLITCNNSFEAEVIKGRLEAEGIPCMIQGENISVIYGAIGAFGVNVLVNEEDFVRAESVLES